MTQKTTKRKTTSRAPSNDMGVKLRNFLLILVPKSKWGRIFAVSLYGTIIAVLLFSFTLSQWYRVSHSSEPLTIGATFVPGYARYFELDPKETMQAMIDDLGIKRFRLVSYWKDYEKEPDQYDFTDLDWQFDMVEAAGGEVSLAMGLRQPRWPECHGPEWAMQKPVAEWTEDLKEFMGVVVDRYKNRAVLTEYQLENEFFLSVFGECPDFSRDRLIDEYNYLENADSSRPIIISRSNNAVGFPLGDPRPDKFALTVYKRVWDKTLTKRYFEYPFPAWFYGFLAGGGEILTGKELFVHELQTEAWLPDAIRDQGFDMTNASIEELYKSMDPERLASRIQYAVDTGMRTIDVWGVEWWYQMKEKRNAPELWDTAKRELQSYR